MNNITKTAPVSTGVLGASWETHFLAPGFQVDMTDERSVNLTRYESVASCSALLDPGGEHEH